jgi:hypothetical protein
MPPFPPPPPPSAATTTVRSRTRNHAEDLKLRLSVVDLPHRELHANHARNSVGVALVKARCIAERSCCASQVTRLRGKRTGRATQE